MPPEVTNTNSKINQDEHAIDCDCKPFVSPTKRMMRYLRVYTVYMYVRIIISQKCRLYIHLKAKRWYLQCTREKRETSREKRDSSREKRDSSREKRDASRETVVTYI